MRLLPHRDRFAKNSLLPSCYPGHGLWRRLQHYLSTAPSPQIGQALPAMSWLSCLSRVAFHVHHVLPRSPDVHTWHTLTP